MRMSIFSYFLGDAFKSLKRNKTMSLASIITIFATLFVFGIFLLIGLNIDSGVKSVEDKIEVKVYMNKDISITEKNQLREKLSSSAGVKEVVFESKEQALQNAKKQLGEYSSVLEGYEDATKNPLPSSYIVKLNSPGDAKNIVKNFEKADGVESIGNDQEIVNTISRIAKTIRWVIVVLFAILAFISVFLIVNTIKLTVFSRRREIGIMKFVGATDWFIRWPFIIEGIIIGLVGAVISELVLYGSYKWLYGKIATQFISVQIIKPTYMLTTMSWQFGLAGIVIGVFGSVIALRKFLAV